MTPSGDGFYYVEDEVNTLVLARLTARCPFASRRGLLAAGGLGCWPPPPGARATARSRADRRATGIEPFWGAHQGGIVTPQQRHTYFAAFDLTTDEARATSSRCCAPGPTRPRA